MDNFSDSLKEKIDSYLSMAQAINLGRISFSSRLILAPMAGITSTPFRMLMQDLGAGGTVSELVSCDGINYNNDRTKKMLSIWAQEKSVGLQLFGSNAQSMANACDYALENRPHFIDINMGCPVKKVVKKGGGSALLQNPQELYPYFQTIKEKLREKNVPLTIKIRTGWGPSTKNADEIICIAKECEIEWVAIHGRTREQQYTGVADWEYLERLSSDAKLPLIGNGDLVNPSIINNKLRESSMQAFMIGRGALRNPFIFLESLFPDNQLSFSGPDYMEVINRYNYYLNQYFTPNSKSIEVHLKKIVVWFSSGFPQATIFRNKVFSAKDSMEIMQVCFEYFSKLHQKDKHIDFFKDFMNGGHG